MKLLVTLFLFFIFFFSAYKAIAKQEFSYLYSDFCEKLNYYLEDEGFEYDRIRPNSERKKQQFVGESPLIYNPDDYYLWVDTYDASNDGVDDLVAIDWVKSGGGSFYLAFYVFQGEGGLYYDRAKLTKFLLNKKFKTIHMEGENPLFSNLFYIHSNFGRSDLESFSGYHVIKPIRFNGVIYIIAEKNDDDKERRILVFSMKDNAVNLNCIF